jgi:hypothetical protein
MLLFNPSASLNISEQFFNLDLTTCSFWKLMLSALKVKRFQPNFAIFSAHFFANSENTTKPKRPSNLGRKR